LFFFGGGLRGAFSRRGFACVFSWSFTRVLCAIGGLVFARGACEGDDDDGDEFSLGHVLAFITSFREVYWLAHVVRRASCCCAARSMNGLVFALFQRTQGGVL
jgi:hypothetical protein